MAIFPSYPRSGDLGLASSMTGFGAAEGEIGDVSVRIEIRAVNHRFLNCSVRVPTELGALEAGIRGSLKQRFARGHVTLTLTAQSQAGAVESLINLERANLASEALRELSTRCGIDSDPSLADIVAFPEVVSNRRPGIPAIELGEVMPMVEAAAGECLAARNREGAVLTVEILDRLSGIEAAAEKVTRLLPARLDRELVRLKKRVVELSSGIELDPARLAQEVAVIADRLDVTEEMVRLQAHIAAAREAIASGEPVGKQLGFLGQEMGREVNTIGSKANDSTIAHIVVAMKGDLEKIREQLENIE